MKLISLFIISGFLLALAGSSSGSITPMQDDSISGMYYVFGTKTSTIYPCTWACFDMDPDVETIYIASVFNIRWAKEIPDTLLFFGLPGANAGESGRYQFREFVFPIELHESDEEYKTYAHFTGHAFEIDIMSAGPRYLATGTLQNGTIEIGGQYHYRNRTFEYHLKGEKIKP